MRIHCGFLAVLMLGLGLPVPALSVGVGYGVLTDKYFTSTLTLDDSVNYGLTFMNDGSSTANIVSITVDGSTADNRPLTWIHVSPFLSGPSTSVSGVGTSLVTLTFGDTFSPGEFIMSSEFWPAPATGNLYSFARDMIGIEVTFTFDDASVWEGVLTDMPPPVGTYFADGLAYLQPVPVPTAAWLFGAGLLGLIGVARRNSKR